jgi:hypothetical protein
MLTDYEESPLQSYDSARALTCSNDKCALYRKTIYRLVKIESFVEYNKILWLCGRCQTQQTVKERK